MTEENNIFIGFQIINQLGSQDKFINTMKEITYCLKAHEQEIYLK